jgi:hypothetical protein
MRQFKLEWNHWRVRYSAGPRNQRSHRVPVMDPDELVFVRVLYHRTFPKTAVATRPAVSLCLAQPFPCKRPWWW